ncbi:hypothetical protein [Streptoalloteichus hindustanus]|uniref:Uncharacterized protein n=1 Tax=Streptoalloteichus hindustanus TaxID=2017 RepID=A0A1M4TT88_STRHI|nr:hypothetical protein [Streptoalloteichus hindustanus]SHE47719.1 hypothetical protein SAMN05444320_101191 [Streptoalloteichus hindustanus]
MDRETCLPVRGERQQGGGWERPSDLEWLKPTPDNLEKLVAPVPEGFTEQR